MLRSMTQTSEEPGFRDVPKTALVTGSSGFVGQRLVEMLVERGAQRVVAFDIGAPPEPFTQPQVETVQGDITDVQAVKDAAQGVECVFHLAALVGPYHEEHTYEAVNYGGCLNVLEACRAHGIRKLVLSSSPSTRFPYPDPNVRGKREDELEADNGGTYSPQFHATYARTKAMGEQAVLEACDDALMTIAVAPHQVYGPRDPLFLPSILEAARGGKLRVFGDGKNKISFTHVDNYCHGLILGAEALHEGSAALGKFYVCTDKEPQLLWDALEDAVTGVGLPSLKAKRALPPWLMMGAARATMGLGQVMSKATGTPYPHVMRKLKLNTFAVKMLLIDRWFDISRAERDLEYVPVLSFDDGWKQTIEYFREREPAR